MCMHGGNTQMKVKVCGGVLVWQKVPVVAASCCLPCLAFSVPLPVKARLLPSPTHSPNVCLFCLFLSWHVESR